MTDAPRLTVESGPHERRDCPVFVPWNGHPPGRLVCEETGEVVACQLSAGKLCAVFPRLEAGTTTHWIADPEPEPAGPAVDLERDDAAAALWMRVSGRVVSAFRFDAGFQRPFLHPLLGPGGAPLTRFYPTEERAGETDDHPHHRGLWTAFGDVNGVDHWLEGPGCGTQRVTGFDVVEEGPVLGRFVAQIAWRRPDGAVQLAEERTLRLYATSPGLTMLELDAALTAVEGDVRFGDTKEGGLCAVRVATPLDADRGGRFENAVGGRGEAECWGEPAPWCAYGGELDGARVGIAAMDHPASFRHPTPWHVRAYGLMAANPFGHSYYGKGFLRDGSWTLPQGETLPFHYRVLAYAGDAREAGVAERYHDYAHPPAVACEP